MAGNIRSQYCTSCSNTGNPLKSIGHIELVATKGIPLIRTGETLCNSTGNPLIEFNWTLFESELDTTKGIPPIEIIETKTRANHR